MSWSEIKREEMQFRRNICEICFNAPAVDAHHALLGDSKRWKNCVTSVYNMQMVCKVCHLNLASSYYNRKRYMIQVVERYGESKLINWLDGMPDKMKLGDRWKEVRRMI